MKKVISYVVTGLLCTAPWTGHAMSGPEVAKPGGVVSQFTVNDDTQVPGTVLKKGAYTIRILDHLSDRMILQVDQKGKLLSTFLALPGGGLAKTDKQGPITLDGGASGKGAIRGFAFPDGTLAEFVYPKAEAVGLAKANDTKIPAIDPSSQGMKSNPALSKTDRQMVTLWLLSPTPVGPNDAGPGIKAERYQPVVADATVPPRPRPRPALTALPHTASQRPTILLMGLFSVSAALLLSRRRLVAS